MTTGTFDLASLDTTPRADAGAELELTHPVTGAPLGVTLTLAGVDSAAYRKAQAALTDKRLGRRSGKLTAAELQRDGIELLARCTLAWSGVVVDGAEVACTADAARELYTRFVWIREQADAFVSERANYLRD